MQRYKASKYDNTESEKRVKTNNTKLRKYTTKLKNMII